jgi:hypothetical protein
VGKEVGTVPKHHVKRWPLFGQPSGKGEALDCITTLQDQAFGGDRRAIYLEIAMSFFTSFSSTSWLQISGRASCLMKGCKINSHEVPFY